MRLIGAFAAAAAWLIATPAWAYLPAISNVALGGQYSMRWLLALFLLWAGPALAGEIDYFCLFTNSAAAQADANVGAFWNVTRLSWDTSTTFPGISVQTSAPNINTPGGVVSSSGGFWIMISRPADSAGLDAACVMGLDRDLGLNNGNFVLFAVGSLNGTARTGLTWAPVPHGSGYPRPLGK